MFRAGQPTEILIISTSEFDDNTFSKCESACLRSQNIQFDGPYGLWRTSLREIIWKTELMRETECKMYETAGPGTKVKTIIAAITHFSHPLSSLAAEKSCCLSDIHGIPFIQSGQAGGLGTTQWFAPCKFPQMTNDRMSFYSPHKAQNGFKIHIEPRSHFRFTAGLILSLVSTTPAGPLEKFI